MGSCLGVIIMIGSLFFWLGLPKYKILNRTIDLSTEFTLSPSKILVTKLGTKPLKVPMSIKNNSDENLSFNITDRIPDRVTPGYSYINDSGLIMFTDNSNIDTSILPPDGIMRFNLYLSLEEGKTLDRNFEAWLSVEPKVLNKPINTELCLRILIQGE